MRYSYIVVANEELARDASSNACTLCSLFHHCFDQFGRLHLEYANLQNPDFYVRFLGHDVKAPITPEGFRELLFVSSRSICCRSKNFIYTHTEKISWQKLLRNFVKLRVVTFNDVYRV